MADSTGQDPDPDLAGPGRIEADLFDRYRLAGLLEDGGSHRTSLPDMTRPGAALASGLDRSANGGRQPTVFVALTTIVWAKMSCQPCFVGLEYVVYTR